MGRTGLSQILDTILSVLYILTKLYHIVLIINACSTSYHDDGSTNNKDKKANKHSFYTFILLSSVSE